MNYDNKNFILAIVLSMLIIFGWQYFYAAPLQKKLEAQQQTQGQTTPPASGTSTTTGAGTAAQAPAVSPAIKPVTRDEALAASPRVKIDTPSITGSVNLKGAVIDDVHLVKYRETIDPKSPTIVFFQPSGTAGALYAEQGLLPATGTTAKLPDQNTLWTAPAGAVLADGNPLTLTWDNGEGLLFKRVIEISDEYLFTITQTVENKSPAAVALVPYARIQRQDTPAVSGYWVFFEGMLGWIDGSLHEVHYKDVADQKEPDKKDSTGGWIGFTDKYWSAIAIPDQKAAVTTNVLHQKWGTRDLYQTGYVAKDAMVVQPGQTAQYRDQLFAGAKVVKTIKGIESKYGVAGFDYMIDWGWFYFLTKPMFYLLDFLKGLVGNFGVAILLATVLVKAAVFPLANKSYASMSKMKKLQPEMEKLKQEYPDDRMKQQQAMMELYKREKVSPLSGCLPVVVQIPVFFSLYKVILTSIEHPGPAAIRYPRGNGFGVDISGAPQKLDIGKAEVLRDGGDVAIIAYGAMVYPAVEAAKELAKSGIQATVINARFVKPLDEELILDIARSSELIVTVEDAYLAGGFGSSSWWGVQGGATVDLFGFKLGGSIGQDLDRASHRFRRATRPDVNALPDR